MFVLARLIMGCLLSRAQTENDGVGDLVVYVSSSKEIHLFVQVLMGFALMRIWNMILEILIFVGKEFFSDHVCLICQSQEVIRNAVGLPIVITVTRILINIFIIYVVTTIIIIIIIIIIVVITTIMIITACNITTYPVASWKWIQQKNGNRASRTRP